MCSWRWTSGHSAMGGYLPTEAGYDDERSVRGAAELHRMRVAPTHQGQRYGRAVLAELEARAVDAGFELLLATTAARQRRAVAFYPAAGYREVDGSTHSAVHPPSTTRHSPVTNEAMSLARKRTALATSSGSANRPAGVRSRSFS